MSLDSIVDEEISFTDTPPTVITARSKGLRPAKWRDNPWRAFARARRSSFRKSETVRERSILEIEAKNGRKSWGSNDERRLCKVCFRSFWISLSKRASSCSRLRAGFKSKERPGDSRLLRRLETVKASGPSRKPRRKVSSPNSVFLFSPS